MASFEKTFKSALLSTKPSGSSHPPIAEEAGVVIGALDSPVSAEEAWDEFLSEKDDLLVEENDVEFAEYVKKLSKVENNIRKFEETCLIGTLWKGTVEIMKLKQNLVGEWSFVKGGFEVVDRQYNWFEIHFASGMEKELVWECCPYHVFGLLLVLMLWKPNFDPSREEVALVELWVRILGIPTEYMTFELLQVILEYNKIGKLQKLDPFTENCSRAKYARVCVKIRHSPKPKEFVILPNFKNAKEKRVLKLWYEGVSEGCINCAGKDHQFNECSQRAQFDRNIKAGIDKFQAKNKDEGVTREQAGKEKEDGWTRVVDKKGKKPMVDRVNFKTKQRIHHRVGKGIKFYDIEDQDREKHEEMNQKHSKEGNEGDAVVPNISTSYDILVPVGPQTMLNLEGQGMDSRFQFPQVSADMAGMELSIYEVCGNFPLGSIQEEGGYLLQDMIKGFNTMKDKATIVSVDEEGEDTDPSFKSTQSRSSMIHKMSTMRVRKEDTSMTDSGKRKSSEGDEDTASSAAKRPRNIDP